MVLSLSVASFAEESKEQTAPAPKAQTAAATPVRATDETANAQIEYLFNNFNTFKQAESADAKWSYAVTDLDHNGRLELLAASVQGDGRYTHVMAWEVGADLASAAPIQVNVPEDESFPDILTDSADTFYNQVSNTWIYMFYDNIVFSADEAYYAKCAVKLADDGLSFQQLAIQHNQAAGGVVNTAYMDNSGNPITGEQYNAAGTEGPAQLIKSSTNFEWVDAANVTSQNMLFNSYAVFKGMMQPTSKTAQPAQAPAQSGGFLTITKNPTNESRTVGGTAYFVANASTWTSLSWTLVSPQGGEYNAVIKDEQVLVMSKKLEHYSAKYSCMTKLDPVSSRLLKEEMDSMINSNMYDQYFEDCLVQMIMFHDFQLFAEDIAGKAWSEVDTVDDLLIAREINNTSKSLKD